MEQKAVLFLTFCKSCYYLNIGGGCYDADKINSLFSHYSLEGYSVLFVQFNLFVVPQSIQFHSSRVEISALSFLGGGHTILVLKVAEKESVWLMLV